MGNCMNCENAVIRLEQSFAIQVCFGPEHDGEEVPVQGHCEHWEARTTK